MGAYRHDLLVAMRVVNKIELEMVQSEWESWLAGETRRCEQVKEVLFAGDGTSSSNKKKERGHHQPLVQSMIDGLDQDGNGADAGDGGKERRAALREWFSEYCTSCAEEQRAVHERMGLSF
jgi:hypothetical protein